MTEQEFHNSRIAFYIDLGHEHEVVCDKVGLNYVSCSPFRVPIARLAAAQGAIENC